MVVAQAEPARTQFVHVLIVHPSAKEAVLITTVMLMMIAQAEPARTRVLHVLIVHPSATEDSDEAVLPL